MPSSPPTGRAGTLRLAALIAAVFLWTAYLTIVLTPGIRDATGAVRGWDFPQFYVNGRLASEGALDRLYDTATLTEHAHRLVAADVDYGINVYGPQIALAFAPLAGLPYPWAVGVWTLISLGLFVASVRLMLHDATALAPHRVTAYLALFASPALILTLLYGQLSAVSLACLAAAGAAFHRGRPVGAGVALGLLAFKPQLALAPTAVMLLAGERKVLAGMAVGAGAQIVATWLLVGTDVMLDYAAGVADLGSAAPVLQQKRHLLQSLLPFFQLLVDTPRGALAAYLLCTAGVVLVAWRFWRSPAPVSVRFAVLLLAAVLVSPHIYVYDLLVLTPALVAVADYRVARPWMQASTIDVSAVLLYLTPLVSAVVASSLQVQVTVPIALALGASVVACARRAQAPPGRAPDTTPVNRTPP